MRTFFFLGLNKERDNNALKEVFCACIQYNLLPTQNLVVMYILFYISKLLCCKNGIVVMIDFFGVAKISLVVFL